MDDTSFGLRHPLGVQADQLRTGLSELVMFPTFGVPDSQLPGLIADGFALIAQAQAYTLGLVAQAEASEIARRRQHAHSTQAWLTYAQHLYPGTAKQHVDLARALQRRPVLAGALAAGQVSLDQVGVIVAAIDELPSDCGQACRDAAEQTLVERAGGQGPTQLKRLGRHLREQADPVRAEAEEAARFARQEEDAHNRRYLRYRSDGYGSTYGSFRLPVADAAMLRAVLDILARPHPEGETPDPRLAEQRRADALVQLAGFAHRDGDLPANGGDRPRVNVTIALADLVQRRGSGRLVNLDERLSVAAVRQLACDCDVIPIVLSADGEPLDVGRARRLFTAAQRAAITERDRHCIHPGCDRPPRWCELHHVRHWADGGPTCIDNGVLLCSFHHHLYDHDLWAIIMGTNGPTHVVPPAFLDLTQEPIPIIRE